MKKAFALIFLTIFLTGCIREVLYTDGDRYTSFPQAEILGASFYYQRNLADVTGDEAGMIRLKTDEEIEEDEKNGLPGPGYKVKMRRRSPSSTPSAMFILGSFSFSDYYKIVCTFPDDPEVADKPYRVYACASVGMDGNVDADYPTAVDLLGSAVFKTGDAIGTFEMTNEGVNTLNPDRWRRPYTTVFLYLYFNNVSDPDDYYEFNLDFVGGANAHTPASIISRAEIYREGDFDNKFILAPTEEKRFNSVYNDYEIIDVPVLALYNHRFDSLKLSPDVSVIDTSSFCLDLSVPAKDIDREIEFDIRNVGLYTSTAFPAPEGSNLISADMIKAAAITGLSDSDFTITALEDTSSNPSIPYYRIKSKIIDYGDMTGIKLVISGTETFTGTSRFTWTLNVPEKYINGDIED